MKLTHFAMLAAIGLLMIVVGCAEGGKSQKGESCTKTSNCADNLRCLKNVCIEDTSGGDSDADADADSDTDSDSDSDAAVAVNMTDCAGGKLDPATNLCWQNPPPNVTYMWSDAVSYCDDLSLGGHNDWRLPKIQELISLLRGCVDGRATGDSSRSPCGVTDPDCLGSGCGANHCGGCTSGEGPGLDGSYWDPALSGNDDFYGSSSSYADDTSYAWVVDFYYGLVGANGKANGDVYVRCVRLGP